MFGYIRPVVSELKVKEYEAYKACYCGLCHIMGKKYGIVSRFLLNYDFVYLTMLLWDKDTPVEYKYKRCLGCPFKKKKFCIQNTAFEAAAALSVILSWWKIQDEINDNNGIRKRIYKFISLLFKKGYFKAKSEYPEFDKQVECLLEELSALEKSKCDSLDKTADCFARLLSSAAFSAEGEKARVLEQVLYHTGRWIYIVDACDDLEDDLKHNNYNAIAYRFSLSCKMSAEVKEYVKTTLLASRNIAGNSFELLDETPWSNTIRNIIFLGMYGISELVVEDKWRKRNRFIRNIKDWN